MHAAIATVAGTGGISPHFHLAQVYYFTDISVRIWYFLLIIHLWHFAILNPLWTSCLQRCKSKRTNCQYATRCLTDLIIYMDNIILLEVQNSGILEACALLLACITLLGCITWLFYLLNTYKGTDLTYNQLKDPRLKILRWYLRIIIHLWKKVKLQKICRSLTHLGFGLYCLNNIESSFSMFPT